MARLIDSKGRILGKVSIIDVLIVVFVVTIIVVGLQTRAKPEPIETLVDEQIVKIELLMSSPYGWYVDAIPTEMRIVKENRTLAEIMDKTVTKESSGNQTYYRISLDVRLLATVNNGVLQYQGQNIKIGNKLVITTPSIDLSGMIKSIEK